MTPAETLRKIADEKLERGSKEWAELHRISGYIEGLEAGSERNKRHESESPNQAATGIFEHKTRSFFRPAVPKLQIAPWLLERLTRIRGGELIEGVALIPHPDNPVAPEGPPELWPGHPPLPTTGTRIEMSQEKTDDEHIAHYRATGEEELAAHAFNRWRDVQDETDTTTWLDLSPLQRKAWRAAMKVRS